MDIRESKIMRHQAFTGLSLAGQKALITGANSGIGKAVAIAMAEAGASVVVNYVNGDDEAHAVADQIVGFGSRAIVCRADVSNECQVADMFEEACTAFGTLDIVVANAGLQRDAPFAEMTLAQWNTVLNVNLTGQFLCARAAVREFLRRGRRTHVSRALGKIICMSSVRSHSVGGSGELRSIQGRRNDADEVDRPGAGTARHPRQRIGSGGDARPDQHSGLVDTGGLRSADAAGAVQAAW